MWNALSPLLRGWATFDGCLAWFAVAGSQMGVYCMTELLFLCLPISTVVQRSFYQFCWPAC